MGITSLFILTGKVLQYCCSCMQLSLHLIRCSIGLWFACGFCAACLHCVGDGEQGVCGGGVCRMSTPANLESRIAVCPAVVSLKPDLKVRNKW